MGRFVETVHLLDFFDDVWVQPLGPAIVAAAGDFATASGYAAGGAAFKAFQIGNHLLNRAARCGLNDQKVDQQNTEQRRDDQ